jgi:predicted YcjX-like family ATPase
MFPVTKRKGSNITILKRGIKYYQNWVINQLHKYYIARHVFL